jgi:hypothetical protein
VRKALEIQHDFFIPEQQQNVNRKFAERTIGLEIGAGLPVWR